MTTLRTLLLLPLSLFAACAAQTWRADAGAMFTRTRGDLALQNAGGSLSLGAEQTDVQHDFGLGDTEPSPFLRAQMDQNRHRVRASGFGIDAEGSGVVGRDFGGIVAGSPVTTSMELFALNANYGYQVARGEHHRIAVGGQAAFYSLDIAARSTLGREQVETQVLVPMPFVEVEGLFGRWTVGANAAFMAADLGDADGRYLDVEVYSRVAVTRQFELLAGYRYLMIDAEGRASSRDFEADVDMQGLFFGAGVMF